MNGNQFENYTVKELASHGWWALRIPRSSSGAQPFDVLAIKGNKILAADCKVCYEPKFPLKRVEDNQWTSFEVMLQKTDATVGIIAYHDGAVYFIHYYELMNAKKSYIPLNDERNLSWVNVCYG